MGIMEDWTAEQAAKRGKVEVLESPAQEVERREQTQAAEVEVVKQTLANAGVATTLQTALLVRVGKMVEQDSIRPADIAAVLRGVSDAKAKEVDAFLKLTGRAPKAPENDTVQLMRSLARDGLLRMNVEIGVEHDGSDNES